MPGGFDEAQHPRAGDGKFTEGGGEPRSPRAAAAARAVRAKLKAGAGSAAASRSSRVPKGEKFNAKPHERKIARFATLEAKLRKQSIDVKAKMAALKVEAREKAKTPAQKARYKARFDKLAARRDELRGKANAAKEGRVGARKEMQAARAEHAAKRKEARDAAKTARATDREKRTGKTSKPATKPEAAPAAAPSPTPTPSPTAVPAPTPPAPTSTLPKVLQGLPPDHPMVKWHLREQAAEAKAAAKASLLKTYDDMQARFHASTSDQERQSVLTYTDSMAYQPLNEALRKGTAIPDDLHQVQRDLDATIARTKLPQAMDLGRAATGRRAFEHYSQFNVGDVYSDKAYVSTSADPDYVKPSTARQEVHLQIKAPPGTNAIPAFAGTDTSHEREILLGRNTKFRVLDKRIDEVPHPREGTQQRLVMTVEIEP